MAHLRKIWTGLGLSASLVAGHVAADAASLGHGVKPAHPFILADSSGTSEGEGAIMTATQEVSLLTLLGLVEGHMRVGVALYEAGDVAAAKTHMKHPKSELFLQLQPMIPADEFTEVGAVLGAVSAAVEAGKPVSDVKALLDTLVHELSVQRPKKLEALAAAQAVTVLLRTAADEYSVGVKDNAVVEAHEYQDAWGFVQAAKALLAGLPKPERDEHGEDLAKIDGLLAGLDVMWPELSGKAVLTEKPDKLFAAAARIEIAALKIK